MSEPSESALVERRFAAKRGLVQPRTSIYSSKSKWSNSAKQGFGSGSGVGIQRISGHDVSRAGGSVSAARARVNKTGKTYVGSPAGGRKASKTQTYELRRGLARRKATAARTGTLKPRRKRG